MHERIKELALQANANELSYAYYRGEKKPENAVTLHSVDLEKFAELIVAECMEVCRRGKYDGRDDMSLIQFNNGIRFCMNAIDNHFGD